MVVRRQKKVRKKRGSRMHGFGFNTQHRGKGSKGGHGIMGGSGKRGQQRKTYWDALHIKPLGRKSMRHKRNKMYLRAINLGDVIQNLNQFGSKSGDVFVVDLAKAGYDKLLSRGSVTSKLRITCKCFSKVAKQKVEAAGGEIISASKAVA